MDVTCLEWCDEEDKDRHILFFKPSFLHFYVPFMELITVMESAWGKSESPATNLLATPLPRWPRAKQIPVSQHHFTKQTFHWFLFHRVLTFNLLKTFVVLSKVKHPHVIVWEDFNLDFGQWIMFLAGAHSENTSGPYALVLVGLLVTLVYGELAPKHHWQANQATQFFWMTRLYKGWSSASVAGCEIYHSQTIYLAVYYCSD